mgnify:CR=1 FL=1
MVQKGVNVYINIKRYFFNDICKKDSATVGKTVAEPLMIFIRKNICFTFVLRLHYLCHKRCLLSLTPTHIYPATPK